MPLWHVQYFPYANLPVVKNSPEARLPHRAVRFGSLLLLLNWLLHVVAAIFIARHARAPTRAQSPCIQKLALDEVLHCG